LQQSLQNLARAFDNFFSSRAKYPRYKSKAGRQSIQYPQYVVIHGSRVHLPKTGRVKCVTHRDIVGKIKTVTVSRNACGQYHASILTDDGESLPEVSTSGAAIGVDVGLTHLAVTSDGSKFKNPRHMKKVARNLLRKERKLSRKKKGSRSREKARRLVARVHERVACARKDYLHKVSRRIVNENQVIAVEDLNVKGLMKNRNVAKITSEVGWGMLIGFIEYKAARDGKALIKCGRWYPSSKACSACGSICGSMPLSVRMWTCAHCGTRHDRDINAAKNIRDEGLRILAGGTPASASGGSVSPGRRRSPRAKAVAKEARNPAL
jgi:putative transposase